VVLPLAVPPATPIRKGSVRWRRLAPLCVVPGELPVGEKSSVPFAPLARLSARSARVIFSFDICSAAPLAAAPPGASVTVLMLEKRDRLRTDAQGLGREAGKCAPVI
jgi:hypothetical protein